MLGREKRGEGESIGKERQKEKLKSIYKIMGEKTCRT
jgi:hypothetical protein